MRIATYLWRWKFAESAVRCSIASDPELASLIEYWFPFTDIEFTRKRGIWCDGILMIEIAELDRTTFRISGVGYFPQDFGPFEIEYHFENRRDPIPRSTVLGFGLLNGRGELRQLGNKDPQYIMGLRPKTNAEWAIAVELTDTLT